MVKADWTANEFIQPASTSLVKTKDGHLKGAIGELIAWKYLKRHCWVWDVAATWPASRLLLADAVRSRYLNTRQLRYLKHHIYTGMHRWDFLAIREHEIHSKNVETRYLVEVKTGVMRNRQKGLRSFSPSLPRGDYTKMIAEVKSFGFTPILVKVGIGHDWTFHVSCKEFRYRKLSS